MSICCNGVKNIINIHFIWYFVQLTCSSEAQLATIDSVINAGTTIFTTSIRRIQDGSFFRDLPTFTPKGLILNITPQNFAEYNEGVKTGDKDLHIADLMTKHGYEPETHFVKTEDGYILTVFRIPRNGKVVFIEHGLASSSDDWVTSGPNTSLAYLLADRGYDVWIGNARGNKHCEKHKRLSPKDKKFWDFSWDEIGRFDLPAIIDYVLEVSGHEKLIYIGHSQGTTGFFVMCSERPEYNNKVSFMVALAAVAWVEHITSPLRFLAPFGQDENSIMGQIIGPSISANDTIQKLFNNVVCGGNIIQNTLCLNLFFSLFGFDNSQINFKTLASVSAHTPGGISTKQLLHYSQNIQSGKFRKYDYRRKNLAVYGSIEPPEYVISNIKVPMAIFQAEADWAADTKDLGTLMSNLQNKFTYHIVPYKSFAHTDFLFAKDVVELVYNDILKILHKVENYSNAKKCRV